MNTLQKKILVHAFGNSGRGDDGLGDEFINKLDRWIEINDIHLVDTDSSYQLNVEYAPAMAEHDIVVFVDASKAEIKKFDFSRVQPDPQSFFSTHVLSPSGVLHLCRELYEKQPETYFLQIKGYTWDMKEELSSEAKINLEEAFLFCCSKLQEWIKIDKEHEHS